ncbi:MULTISPECIES: ATP-binding cassette domain-containing protein [Pseudanabaena]|uniref:Sulfate-transporting ATPase, Quaternary-amine-transporting ATPase n=2 Tax=Pseudanabaena TaxID=1152 RepID=L8N1M5_9CYAN|nr:MULTISPECIES: ATP-binding cassette domain-containing protein [Pseudanabaena]ELS32635.1 Sulfate-transporting ATPase, Quaternary-amine-transporting ATPase [Pseudanabaena biceps PCC 7429]MDG3495127.1 ATP-binding cassette domain-containing protein [Pseudanabaena catenata USMAC16]
MLLTSNPSVENSISFDSVISVRNLSKRYGDFLAVKGIDFAVQQGEIFGLIGPDGAGKTTCFHILGGVMESSGGEVLVLGEAPRTARLNIGYLTQQFSLYLDLSIDENLRYSAGLRQVPDDQFQLRRDKYLRLMSLERIGDRLAGQLSGGMKQKLALCCALVSQPRLLLLDEPTTGVDPVSRREFWDVLAALADDGMTIVVATPYLDEAERCNRIALMYEGQISEIGTLPQLRANLGLQRLEVRTSALAAAEEVLLETARGRPSIADVQTFGDRLDVLVENLEADERAVRQAFSESLVPIDSIQASDATLENVFVTRLRQQGSDPLFLPFPRSKAQNLSEARMDNVAIAARNLQKTFGKFRAVKEVNLEIHYGEIYGLLGANGAGKTTTIKMLCGLLEATSGKMTLAGQSQNLRSSALRKRIGYMSQKFTLYDDLSILQNLEFYCGVYEVPQHLRQQKIAWVLETCGLIGRENMLTGKLPGGWKQRVSFGASVMHEPEILFLDEPTSGVDPLARRQFWRTINDFARQGTAILVTTHYLEEAEQCNRMGFMVAGEVVLQGSPTEVKAAQVGQLIELKVDRNQQAANYLKTILEPWRVSIFGDRLHVVLDDPSVELPQMRSHLAENHIQIFSDRPVPFSLEDAFIGTVQRSEAGIAHLDE